MSRAPSMERSYIGPAFEDAKVHHATIPSDASLREAGKLMGQHRISHLVAVQPEDGRPAGVISSRDLAAAAAYGRS